jgi:hypothetical protein
VAGGAISQNKIKEKPLPPYPTQAENLLNFCVSSLPMTSGVNVELLGLADRQQAGIVESQRTKAALTILATLFDALRLYRKRQGKVMAYYILEYLSDGRLIRITGNQGDMQYIPLMKQRDFMEYDVIVDEAVSSRDVKERTWVVMSQLLPMIQGMGIPIPPGVLDYSPLPTGLIADWKKEITQARQNPPPNPMDVQHKHNMEEIQAKAQAEVHVKQAEIQLEGQKAQQAESDSNIQAQVDLRIADINAQKDVQIAQYKADKEAETAILVAEIKANADAQVKMQQNELQARQAERQETIKAEMAQKQEQNSSRPARLEIEGLPDLVAAITKPKVRKGKKSPDGTFTMTEE